MIRWAVSGSGNMASLFVKDSEQVTNGQFVAVYSSQQSRADAFAKQHQLAHAYSDYDALLANPDIDAVYIASTHPHHAAQAIRALNAGKHVLVEKPMALSPADAREVFAAAKANQRFCAEALWTKFAPAYQTLMAQLQQNRIGDVRHINASFGFAIDLADTQQRLLNPEHAGGALLDIGLYPIFLPLTLFGVPDETKAQVTMGDSGVDIATDLIMSYQDGRSATISYRFDVMLPTKAAFSGTLGWAELESPFFASNAIHWHEKDRPGTTEHIPLVNRGWGYEFEAVNAAIVAGELEAVQHSWQDSLQLSEYLHFLRNTWGPHYPFEEVSE